METELFFDENNNQILESNMTKTVIRKRKQIENMDELNIIFTNRLKQSKSRTKFKKNTSKMNLRSHCNGDCDLKVIDDISGVKSAHQHRHNEHDHQHKKIRINNNEKQM